jgi:polyisoprenoid-binding protein YceI
MKKISIFLLVGLFLLPAGALQAAQWSIDTAHSGIRFGVQHIYSTVYGSFEEYDGKILFDPDEPAKSSFNFTVQVKSVQTGIGKRDTHLRSPDFFDAKKFPKISFTSSSVTPAGEGKYEVAGTLTIKDVSKEVILPVIFHGIKDHPMKKGSRVAGFDFNLTIDRLDYQVGNGKFFKLGVVGKEVDIFVSLEALQ